LNVTAYILRRLLWVPVLLLGITLLTFVIFTLAPGDPVTALIKPGVMEATTQIGSGMEVLRERYGLDKPIHVRYVIWLGEVLRGNLGYSYTTDRPISEMIAEVLPATLLLQASSIGMALLFGIILGVMSALKQYSVVDHALTFVALFGISVPSFFIALIAMFIFAVKLGWLPIAGMWTVGEPRGFNLDLLRHMILPSMAGGIVHIASFLRYTRASMLDALSGDYVVTARAKGLPEWLVILRHTLRNALMPLVTIIGLSLPVLLGGSFIIETIFSWNGLGLLGYRALMNRDYPLQMGMALMVATMVMLANLIADIAYVFVDPRVRYE
jgi:peptide/nickel transport system permease protein